MTVDALGQQLQANRPAFVGGIGLTQIAEDMRQIGLRLLDGKAVPDARHRPQPVVATTDHPGPIEVDRRVDGVAPVERKAKTGGHDANNRVGLAIQLDRLVQNVPVAAEVVLPHLVTQHRNVVFTFLLFPGQKGTPQHRLDAKHLEEVICRADVRKLYRTVGRRLHRGVEVIGITGQRGEGAGLRALVLVTGPGGGLRITAGAAAHDVNDAIRMRIGQRTQDHVIDDAKNRGGHAHAEGQREHHGNGESGGAAKLAQRVAKILKQRVHFVLSYSLRKACIGSTEAARRAGR